jgi:hypothetical protein
MRLTYSCIDNENNEELVPIDEDIDSWNSVLNEYRVTDVAGSAQNANVSRLLRCVNLNM